VTQTLAFYLDAEAEEAVRGLWRRLAGAGLPVPSGRPHVTFAAGRAIPPAARRDLAADLALLSLPEIWLYTLGAFPTSDNVLFLGAVADAELLAVHIAVHDALAGRVRDPNAYCLPGAWVPHCALTAEASPTQLAAAFTALHPVTPVRAAIADVCVVDTRTGEADPLWSA
jgi:hypothetical protein